MNEGRGIFIVIEGIDGSGKATQFALLKKRLEDAGHDVACFDFPQYNQPSSYFVKQYLQGRYGGANDISPYAASLFFALDRYDASQEITKALGQGKIVLANRFSGSNMAHQGTKFINAEERRGYFIWSDNLEFEMLHIPRPDISFVLRMPAETARQLISSRSESQDIRESDATHLEKSVEVYDDLCKLFPKDFQRIDCVRDGKLLDIPTVGQLIWQKVTPWLPERATEKIAETNQSDNCKYYVPVLPDDINLKYRQIMDELIKSHSILSQKLGPSSNAAQLVLPIALDQYYHCVAADKDHQAAELATKYMASNHSDISEESIQLTSYWPKNELDLVTNILYAGGDKSLHEVRQQTDNLAYSQKLEILEAYFTNNPSPRVLDAVTYSWDIVSDVATYVQVCCLMPDAHITHQLLSPRNGYSVPPEIEYAGLADQFDACFDKSLELYSTLQQSGNAPSAQYAVLLGHRLRWHLTITANELHKLLPITVLHQKLAATLTDTHPNLANQI